VNAELDNAVFDVTVAVPVLVLNLNPLEEDVLKNSKPDVEVAFDQLLIYSPVPAKDPLWNFA
jgi:hypothetical protein